MPKTARAWWAEEDDLARFVTDRGKIEKPRPSARKSAFVPPKPEAGKPFEISTFTTLDASEKDLRNAADHVARGKGRTVHGAMVVPRSEFLAAGLDLIPGCPVFGASVHTNVRGWPGGDNGDNARKEIAARLGRAATILPLVSEVPVAGAED